MRFFREIAELFPKLNILVYHNPALHHVTLPVEAFEALVKIPQIVGMKDSHRDTMTFMKLQQVIAGKISVMCNQLQYVPFAGLGAAGLLVDRRLDGAVAAASLSAMRSRAATSTLRRRSCSTSPVPAPARPNLSWRETGSKLAIAMAGYVDPGPLRPPFLEIPADVVDTQRSAPSAGRRSARNTRRRIRPRRSGRRARDRKKNET